MTGRRRWVAATAVAAAVATAVWGGPAPPARSRALPAPSPLRAAPAIQGLADCILSSNRLLLLMLIDESGSLAETDPANQRVTAAKAALSELARLAEAESQGGRPTVVVQLAGFSDDFRTATSWTRLDTGSLPGLQSQVDGFAARNRGLDTDFATALDGAQAALARGAAALTQNASPPPCQALVLFTDGNYDIQPRHVTKFYAKGLHADTPQLAARMVELGRGEVCRPEGLADQLRRDRVTTFTVALTGGIGSADRRFLRSMTEGIAGGTACGRRSTSASGLYLGVAGHADLVQSFYTLVNLIDRGTPGPPDRSRSRPFQIDPGLRRFNLLIDLGQEGLVARLRSPASDRPLVLNRPRQGRAALGSARATYGWLSPTALTVDVTLPRATSDWVGRWLVTFTDPDGKPVPAGSQIFLFGDLIPDLVETPAWHRGESGQLAVRVVDSAGTPRRPKDVVRSTGVEAVVTDPATGAQTPVELAGPRSDGSYRGSWPVPASLDASRVNLTVRLSVTTRSGLALAPVSRTWPVAVRAPASYPTVAPFELQLPSLTGKGARSGSIIVTGGPAGAGCVWFETAPFEAPASAGPVKVSLDPAATSQGRCIRLAAGACRSVRLTVEPRGTGNGLVEGTVVARLRSDNDRRELITRVPVRFTIERPPDPGKRLWLFLLLFLGGVAFPLVVLYLLNLLFAKFEPTDLLRVATIPVVVVVDGDRVHRRTAGGGIGALLTDVRPDELANVEAGSPVRMRSLALGPLRLRTRVPRLPLTAPYGEAAADGRHVTAAEGRLAGRPSTRGRLPLELGGSWAFVLEEPVPGWDGGEPDGDRVDGRLYALVDEPLSDQGERLAEVVQRDLPAAAQELAAVAAAARPPAGEDAAPEDSDPEPAPQEPVKVEPDY